MPRKPDIAIFTCESCGYSAEATERTAKHLLRSKRNLGIETNGLCGQCGGDSWTICLRFVDHEFKNVGTTLVTSGLAGVIRNRETHLNEQTFSGVNAKIVTLINGDPAQRLDRLAQFATASQRIEAKEKGSQECPVCNTLFVPREEKPWSEKGYCSKICFLRKEGSAAVSNAEAVAPPKMTSETFRAKTMRVRCPQGHVFDIAVSFRGLKRPCPDCGVKTIIKDAPA